jgi:hypothetical protein
MREKLLKKQTNLFLVSAAILLVGLGSAVAIYLDADDEADGKQGYEVAGKYIYPAMNERSKRYQHDLEMYGGKAAVLADDFNRWFYGLWRGRSLAFTIAVISILLSFSFFVAARNAHPDGNADMGQEEDQI